MPALRLYADHNASAPLRPAARDAMFSAMERPGNASSVHAEGRAARAFVEQARRQVAALVGADPRGVVFTSGATEAANLVLSPALEIAGRRPARLLFGATEHPCVREGHRFAEATVVPVDRDGILHQTALADFLAHGAGTPLLALQAANNETGILQPVAEAAAKIHAAGGLLVCDAVQAVGRIPLMLASTDADVIILTSHKLGGPKGAGALVFADPDAQIAAPLIRGGGQERGFRAGTEDIAAIAGFGAACTEVLARGTAEAARVNVLRDAFEADLRRLAPEAIVFGAGSSRLPNTSCFAVPGVKATTVLMGLDLAGIAVSAGSACASGKVGRSPVLDAMGVHPHMADGAVRVSFGWSSQAGDVAALTEALANILARLAPGRAA